MNPTLGASLAVACLVLGCGGSDAPTTPTPRTYTSESTTESTIRAHAASCVGFRQEAAGEASASANFFNNQAVPIEIGAGTCTGTRSVIARGDRGAIVATVPVGDSFVRFENTSDSDARYSLTLRHLRLY
jgi:hypothetical protein